MTRSRSGTSSPSPVVLFAALLVSVMLGIGQPAGAQANGSLELVAQSAWADDGGLFDVQVRVAGATPNSTVRVLVHRPWSSRPAHQAQTLPGDGDDVLLEIGPLPLSSLQETSNEVLSLEIAIVGPDTAIPEDDPEDDIPPLPILQTEGESAVYPLEIILEDADGNVADRILTSLIELPRGQSSPPLQVVLILPIDLPNGIGTDGIYALDEAAGPALETIVEAMTIHPESRVTLDVAPESLAAFARSSAPRHQAISDQLRTVIDADELLPNPYVKVSEQSWLDAGLEQELADLYAAGIVASQRTMGLTSEGSVVVLDPDLNAEGLDWLIDQGAQGAIVPSSQLDPLDGAVFGRSLDRQFLLGTASGRRVPALEADQRLQRHFIDTGEPVENANRMLADLTLLALEQPELRRSAVAIAPAEWQPNANFLNVLLSGVERIPLLTSATPRTALAQTELINSAGDGTISPPLRRTLQPTDPEPLGSFRTEFNQAALAIESWATVIEGDPDSVRRLRELLLVAADERNLTATRADYIDRVYELINEQKNRAVRTPEAETITLTGREADVPIVVENRLSVPIRVTLVLDSEKLAFPDGKDVGVVLDPGQNRIEVPIEARATGDSPIRVQILSPDREVLLGSSQLRVRSFAFSGVGVIIGAVALLILVLWWLRHRRDVRATLEPALP
jgi:hypothetical protein